MGHYLSELMCHKCGEILCMCEDAKAVTQEDIDNIGKLLADLFCGKYRDCKTLEDFNKMYLNQEDKGV